MPFQTSISRSVGHSATRLASSVDWRRIRPRLLPACWACAVMLFSVSIVYVVILLFLYRRLRS